MTRRLRVIRWVGDHHWLVRENHYRLWHGAVEICFEPLFYLGELRRLPASRLP